MVRRLGALALLALSVSASAHTAITSLSPAPFTTVSAPKAVQMTFSEPIDLHFATFKVYPLAATGDHSALSQAADALKKSKLPLRGDEDARADLAPRLSGTAARLSLPLRADLKPGNYALLWRILSDDGHVVSGQSVFGVR